MWMFAAILICGTAAMFISCDSHAIVMGTGTWVWVPVFMSIFLLYS